MHHSGPKWLRWTPELESAAAARQRTGAQRISFGADYNPEQWPRDVWDEDIRLMKEAGVDVVSVAIFSWARLQPARDQWDFAWLDEVMGLLAEAGIGADLATATASPPAWLVNEHPEVLPVTEDGTVLSPGGRQHWRPTSPVFREHALRLVRTLAQRYRDHPALVAWHVNNELGCHNIFDYSDDAAYAFQKWLESKYGQIEALNHAWSTDFWSQRYSRFTQILPPRRAASFSNPSQQLDFHRFSSDALKQHFIAERDLLKSITPEVPVTTNFMVMGQTKSMNYADWAQELDFVSNDHYRQPIPQSRDELSFSAAMTSGLAQGHPWYLMEHSTSAVNWQAINKSKRAGELERDSLTHVAHGADAVCYFQWRQSAGGAEKYHSAMVPHAGENSRIFRQVVGLGNTLRDLAPVASSRREPAQVAVLMDWESWWASELDAQPSSLLRYKQEAFDWWRALLNAGVRADVVQSGSVGTEADFANYKVVFAPILHVVPQNLKHRLEEYVASGGHLVTTYFSGIVDQDDRVWLGGYPGALRDLLGIRVEEFSPLNVEETLTIDDGTSVTIWSEQVDLLADEQNTNLDGEITGHAGYEGHVEVLRRYRGGDLDGLPAVTRKRQGNGSRLHGSGGSASYVSTRLSDDGRAGLLPELLADTGVEPEIPEHLRGSVEFVQRVSEEARYLFIINRTDEPQDISSIPGEPLARTEPAKGATGPVQPDSKNTLGARGVEVRRIHH